MPVGLHRDSGVIGGRMYPLPVKPVGQPPRLSSLSHVSLRWSAGQGVRRPGASSSSAPGLYLSASVKNGHGLQVDKVTVDRATKTVTVVAVGRGAGAPTRGAQTEEKLVRGGFSMRAERWTVVVVDPKGKLLANRPMMLGGPPAR